MARDYKHRAQAAHRNSKNHDANGAGLFRWMLITALIIGFVVFLVYLKSPQLQKAAPQAQNQQTLATKKPEKEDSSTKAEKQKPAPPQFDFYTILPKKEVVVPDHEMKARTREEQIGKNKKASYVIQAGSSKDFKEADEIKAKLALMGIESKIQKAKVESSLWYRVKIGPYNQMGSVNNIMSRLQKMGMKPIITEVDG